MNEKEISRVKEKIKKIVGENNYKLALAITGHRPGKIRDVVLASKEGELLLDYIDNLEKQNKFLMERENKLQLIETMFKNGLLI